MQSWVLCLGLLCLAGVCLAGKRSAKSFRKNGVDGPDDDSSTERRGKEEDKLSRARASSYSARTRTPGRSEASFCVELTHGWTSYFPTNTPQFGFWKRGGGGRCGTQGSLITFKPSWANTLSVHMVFENPKDYSFHIGDYKSSFSDDLNNAQIIGKDRRVMAYSNDGRGSRSFWSRNNVVKTALLIRIYRNVLYITNYMGVSQWVWPKAAANISNIFHFKPHALIYMGLNHIFNRYDGHPKRVLHGRGLCNVCLFWN